MKDTLQPDRESNAGHAPGRTWIRGLAKVAAVCALATLGMTAMQANAQVSINVGGPAYVGGPPPPPPPPRRWHRRHWHRPPPPPPRRWHRPPPPPPGYYR